MSPLVWKPSNELQGSLGPSGPESRPKRAWVRAAGPEQRRFRLLADFRIPDFFKAGSFQCGFWKRKFQISDCFSTFRVRRFTESPGPLHWIALFVENLAKPPIHWIASPLFTEKPFFFASPSQKSAQTKNPNFWFQFWRGFWSGFFPPVFSKEKGPKKSTKKSPANYPRTLFRKIPRISAEDCLRDLSKSVLKTLSESFPDFLRRPFRILWDSSPEGPGDSLNSSRG